MNERRLGSYRSFSLLGAGGMGEVYRAFDESLQRDVAIKLLPAATADDAGARARLLREARAAAALNHPNICTIYEVGEQDGQAFIAMEFVDGEPLNRIVPPGNGLPIEQVLDYGSQMADALAHAHERGILHRDLKSQNVVITKAGRAKVLDFGLAKRVAFDTDTTTDGWSTLTAPGTVVGTPAYIAPEQLRGVAADARTDVWALGVVLYEMTTGRKPFAGQTPYELTSAILNEPPPPLPHAVPDALQAVVARCLEKDPDARYQRANEAFAALDDLQRGGAPARRPQARPTRRAPRVLAIGAAAVVLLTSLAGLMFGSDRLRDLLPSSGPMFDSIAVLPLQQAGATGEDYLAFGLQQALITELAQLPGFTKVIAASSTRRFLDLEQPPRDIARALDVRALVTGSLTRTGDRIRLDVQLIDGTTEGQVWAHTAERPLGEIVALQNEVIEAIARAIELRVSPDARQRLAARATISPDVYELYLRGMREIDGAQEGGEAGNGLAYLQQAIDRDPGDAHAYAGLAKGYVTLGHSPAGPPDAWIRARAAAEHAVKLAPDLADAHAALASVKLYSEWDWAGAEREFRLANELNPNLAMNHYHYAWFLFLMGRLDEALVEHERAREIDPLTPSQSAWLASLYIVAKRYDEARELCEQVLQINPRAAVALQVMSDLESTVGRHDEAIALAQRAVTVAPRWTFALGLAYARAGRTDEARATLAEMLKRPTNGYSMWARSMVYLYLGDADGFFTSIGHEPHHGWAPFVTTVPEIAHFKGDPRYAALFGRFKLPLRGS